MDEHNNLRTALGDLQQEWASQLQPRAGAETEAADVDMQRALQLSMAHACVESPANTDTLSLERDRVLRQEQDAAFVASMEADRKKRTHREEPAAAAPPPPPPPPSPPSPSEPSVLLRVQLPGGEYQNRAFAPTAPVADIEQWAQHRAQRAAPVTVFDPLHSRRLVPEHTLAWYGIGSPQVVRVRWAA